MPAQSLSHVHLIATPGTVAFWAFYTHTYVCVCVYTQRYECVCVCIHRDMNHFALQKKLMSTIL